MENPDNWVILKIINEDSILYKVLAGWSGGYLGSNSWKLNSSITSVEKIGKNYEFTGVSGNVYICHEDHYRLRMNTAGIFKEIMDYYGDKVEMMSEDTDWLDIEWGNSDGIS